MDEITGPVIATTLVLVAVFAPVGFVSGVTGALYRQFAVTISVSVVISAVNALSLSPALCALMLRPPRACAFLRYSAGSIGGFDFARDKYTVVVSFLSGRLLLAGGGIVLLFLLTYGMFSLTPSAFLPEEDQGYIEMNVQLPNGASLGRTEAVQAQITAILRKTPGVAHVICVSGFQPHHRRARGQRRLGARHPHALEPTQTPAPPPRR